MLSIHPFLIYPIKSFHLDKIVCTRPYKNCALYVLDKTEVCVQLAVSMHASASLSLARNSRLMSSLLWNIDYSKSFLCSLGGIADVDLAIRSRNIKDDVMVVSTLMYMYL